MRYWMVPVSGDGTSDRGLGVVLSQVVVSLWVRKYSTINKKCLAIKGAGLTLHYCLLKCPSPSFHITPSSSGSTAWKMLTHGSLIGIWCFMHSGLKRFAIQEVTRTAFHLWLVNEVYLCVFWCWEERKSWDELSVSVSVCSLPQWIAINGKDSKNKIHHWDSQPASHPSVLVFSTIINGYFFFTDATGIF